MRNANVKVQSTKHAIEPWMYSTILEIYIQVRLVYHWVPKVQVVDSYSYMSKLSH